MIKAPGIHYDIIIVGGGLPGLVCAILLTKIGLRCAVIEKTPGSAPQSYPVTINRAAEQTLRAAQIWQNLPKDALGILNKIQIWNYDSSATISFDSASLSAICLGHTVYMEALMENAKQALDHLDIDTFCPAQLTSIRQEADHLNVCLDDGQQLNTRLLIGADGRRSSVRTLAKIGSSVKRYHESAITSVIETQKGHQKTARQWFLDNGILALLPMHHPHQCTMVWSLPDPEAKIFIRLNKTTFCQYLTDASNKTLGEIKSNNKILCWPLYQGETEHYALQRVVLIGDAAHSVHPLAGQGLNLGLLDTTSLVTIIKAAKNEQLDFSSKQVLQRYARWRRSENFVMMQAISGIHKLFKSHATQIQFLQRLGMGKLDKMPFIKRFLMRYASGLSGDLPDLSRCFS